MTLRTVAMSLTAQILSQNTYRIPGKFLVTEYFFRVPVDHTEPDGPSIRLFARGITKAEPATATFSKANDTSSSSSKSPTALPWLTYLQGGPGYGCRPPTGSGWVGAALEAGYRVLLLDQRGTGLSTPVTPSKLAAVGREAVKSAGGAAENAPTVLAAQAAYLRHFRAPGIVADAEAVRRALALADGAESTRKWSIMGQSFGGFCTVHYLSRFPEGLNEAFVMGGLPPIKGHPDAVYERLVRRWIERTKQYYAKFPEDVDRVHRIAEYLAKNKVRTPSGGNLTVNRLRGLGIDLGFHGGFVRMHNLIMRIAADLEYDGELSEPTINDFEHAGLGFDQAILYALVHEPCYLQNEAANWSAERAIAAAPEYGSSAERFHFTAEAVVRSVFTDYASLIPLQDLGDHLAQSSEWDSLYDATQLARNTVPTYAAVYMDDQYVDFDLSRETAKSIANCRFWATNVAYHDAIGAKAEEVMRQLMAMRDDVID